MKLTLFLFLALTLSATSAFASAISCSFDLKVDGESVPVKFEIDPSMKPLAGLLTLISTGEQVRFNRGELETFTKDEMDLEFIEGISAFANVKATEWSSLKFYSFSNAISAGALGLMGLTDEDGNLIAKVFVSAEEEYYNCK